MLIIRDELERMSRMVRDLQALTRSNQSDFIKAAQANLSDLADALFVKASALADREFSLAFQDKDSSGQPSKQPTSWVLDEQRITQAVLQLVSNAVSHTTQGQEIRIAISQEQGKLQIAVEDAGSGIPLETRDRVTKRFARGSEAARKGEGAGLGLALVSAIAAAHGGELVVTDSDLGGAKVALLLPA
jgi:signal transduction histidine kinase